MFHLPFSFPRDEISNPSLPGSQASRPSHNPTFMGSCLEETYHRVLSLQSHRPARHRKASGYVSLQRTLTNMVHSTKMGHEVVCRWPPCLPSCGCMAARPPCTTHNDYMELCLGTVRPEGLDSSSLPALCQVFSSQVKPCQPHDPQKYIAVPMVLSLWLCSAGVPCAMYALSTAYIMALQNCSFQSLLHTARWYVCARFCKIERDSPPLSLF